MDDREQSPVGEPQAKASTAVADKRARHRRGKRTFARGSSRHALFSRRLMSIAVLSLFVSACRENAEPDEARALRDRLEDENYLAWPRVPGFEKRRASETAHGRQVDVYWNRIAQASAAVRPFEALAPGSVLAKEAFDGNVRLNVAVMEKRQDGWFWAEWDNEGEVLFSGRPGICIDCHRRGEDFLRTITPSETVSR